MESQFVSSSSSSFVANSTLFVGNVSIDDELNTNGDENENVYNLIESLLVFGIFLIVMFAMGCGVSKADLKGHLLKPTGLIMGIACQFILMPILALCVIKLFDLEGSYGTGVLFVSCCPGGTMSNVLTFYANGDITLSVTMTTFSSGIALLAMPANLWFYGHFIETGEAVIPYALIAKALAFTLVPAIIGFTFKIYHPKWASFLTNAGSALGLFLVFVLLGMNLVIHSSYYIEAPWQLYLSAIVLPPLGLTAAYSITRLSRQSSPVQRTVAIEAGVQNVGVAIAIANLSFSKETVGPVLVYPFCYAITMIICVGGAVLLYRIVIHSSSKYKTKDKNQTSSSSCNASLNAI